MAIAFSEIGLNRAPRSAAFSATGYNRYTRSFQAETQDRHIEQNQIFNEFLSWSGFILGTPYQVGSIKDPFSYLYNITVDEISDDGLQWRVVCNWSEFDANQMGGFNPLNAPIQKSFSFRDREVAVGYVFDYNADGSISMDAQGNPVGHLVTNSAGDLFTTPIMRRVSEPVFKVTRNETTINKDLIGLLSQSLNFINNATWLGFAARTARFDNAEISYNWHPRIFSYATVQYIFSIKFDTWDTWVLDAGYRATDPSDGLIKPILAPGGLALVSNPQPLDGQGGKLPKDTPPVFLKFSTYAPIDFSIFNFL